MSKGRKKFDCGHRGFGQLCHRCEQAKRFEHLSKHPEKIKPKGEETKEALAMKYGEEAKRLFSNPKKVTSISTSASE